MTGTLLDIKELRHELMATYLNVTIALQIKAMREAKGWTQTELAQKIGCHPSQISGWEEVRWKNWPNITTLLKIAAAFDVALELKFRSWSSLIDEFMGGVSATEFSPLSFEEEFEKLSKTYVKVSEEFLK